MTYRQKRHEDPTQEAFHYLNPTPPGDSPGSVVPFVRKAAEMVVPGPVSEKEQEPRAHPTRSVPNNFTEHRPTGFRSEVQSHRDYGTDVRIRIPPFDKVLTRGIQIAALLYSFVSILEQIVGKLQKIFPGWF